MHFVLILFVFDHSSWSQLLPHPLWTLSSFPPSSLLETMLCSRVHEFSMVRKLINPIKVDTLDLLQVFPGLSVTTPAQAPRIFSWTTPSGVPLPALFLTSSISALCFGSSYIGSGKLWGWLQNIVGVSNQVCLFFWESCFVHQFCAVDCMVFYRIGQLEVSKSVGGTRKVVGSVEVPHCLDLAMGTPFCCEWFVLPCRICSHDFKHNRWSLLLHSLSVSSFIAVGSSLTPKYQLVQGWPSVIPTFSAIDFVSFYIEVPVMFIMYVAWMLLRHPSVDSSLPHFSQSQTPSSSFIPLSTSENRKIRPRLFWKWWHNDLVDVKTVDLNKDEYTEEGVDKSDEEERDGWIKGPVGLLWRLYYWLV